PKVLELIERNRKGQPKSPEEHRVYVIFVLTAARLAQSAHYQMRLGLLNEFQLESVMYNLVRHLNSPGGRAVWSELAPRSDPQFRQYVEALAERLDDFDTIMTPEGWRAPYPRSSGRDVGRGAAACHER